MHAEVTAAIYWDLWRLKTVEHDGVVTRLDVRQATVYSALSATRRKKSLRLFSLSG
jgi:hypothetical protein